MSELTNLLTNIANSIRTVEGSSETIVANDFPNKILSLGGGKKCATGFFTVEKGALPDSITLDFTPSIFFYCSFEIDMAGQAALVGMKCPEIEAFIAQINSDGDIYGWEKKNINGITIINNIVSFYTPKHGNYSTSKVPFNGEYMWVAVE